LAQSTLADERLSLTTKLHFAAVGRSADRATLPRVLRTVGNPIRVVLLRCGADGVCAG
jgi:hypothetical protein